MANPCWKCANAYGGCSWSRNFQPVEGWIAKFVQHTKCVPGFTSYNIIFCPEFKPDGSEQFYKNRFGLKYDPDIVFKLISEGKTEDEIQKLVLGIPKRTIRIYKMAYYVWKGGEEKHNGHSHCD